MAQTIRLDQIDPADVEVVKPAPSANPETIRLDQIDPADVEIVSTPPLEKSLAGKAYSWLTNDGQPQDPTVSFATKVPIIGRAGRSIAEHARAGVDWIADHALDAVTSDPSMRGNHSYSAILDSIQNQRKRVDANFAEQHPFANTAVDVASNLAAGALLPIPGAVKAIGPELGTGVALGSQGSALARIAGTAGTSWIDKALDTGSFDEAKQAATLGGGIQAGIEALPYIGKPLAPLANLAAPVVKNVAGKVVSAFGGVNAKNTAYYLENQAAVKGAKTLQEITNLADSHISGVNYDIGEARLMHAAAKDSLAKLNETITTSMADTAAVLESKVAEAKDALRQSFMGRVQGLKQKTVPLESADEVVGMLRNEKAVLGKLSEQADDALARSGLTFQKEHLLSFIDHVGSSLGVGENNTLVGETAVKAAGSLASLRQRIADGMEDTITAPTLRGILRQVRKDIDFDLGASEFNDALNAARKQFTGKISDLLKVDGQGELTEYGQIMGRMHELSSSLEEMGQHFNTREQALASLQTLAGGRGPKSKVIDDVLARYTKAIGNNDVRTKLGDFESASRTLQNPLEKEALRRGLPEFQSHENAQSAFDAFRNNRAAAIEQRLAASPEQAAVQQTRSDLADAMTRKAQYSGWAPGSTESRLKSVMSGRSSENAKTLEALSADSGLDFKAMLKNRAVADAFEKGYMHGSRNVNLWSMVGMVFHGKAMSSEEERVARAAGGAWGGMIDQAGPKITQKLLDGFMFLRDSRFRPVLERAYANGPAAFMAQHQLLMRNEQYRKGIEGESK